MFFKLSIKITKAYKKNNFDWAKTWLIHENASHSAYTLSNSFINSANELTQLHLTR